VSKKEGLGGAKCTCLFLIVLELHCDLLSIGEDHIDRVSQPCGKDLIEDFLAHLPLIWAWWVR